MINRSFLLLLLLALSYSILAQDISLSGQIIDLKSGKGIKSATVSIRESSVQSVTDKNGYYVIDVPLYKESILIISHVKYGRKVVRVNADLNSVLPVITLAEKSVQMAEVIISANKLNRVPEKKEHSASLNIDPKMVQLSPSLGEPDLLKTLQLLPGVQQGGDGASTVLVRGGSSDQNLVMFEGARIYNPTHLLGFMSTFNFDVVESVNFYKGGIPARYSGRLSSVIEFEQKQPKEWISGTFTLSPIATTFTLSGPFNKKNKDVVFLIGFRKSWLDLLLVPIPDATKIGFGDFNFSVGASNNRAKITASFYASSDKVKNNYSSTSFTIRWNSLIAALNLEYKLAKHYNTQFGIHYSDYTYKNQIKSKSDNLSESVESKIRDLVGRWSNELEIGTSHKFIFGASATLFSFDPVLIKSNQSSDSTIFYLDEKVNALDYTTFAEVESLFFNKLFLNVGVALTGFNVSKKNYFTPEPRVYISYDINNRIAINGSYTLTAQYLHRLTNESFGPPVELWVPSTNQVRPQIAEQLSLGFVIKLNKSYELSLEAYHKQMENAVAVLDGQSGFFVSDQNWEEALTAGSGLAKGIEFMLSKKKGRFTGWLSYTYSQSMREYDLINGGEAFPFKYDRPHDISLSTTFVINKNKILTTNFVFSSGYNITLPEAKFYGFLPTQNTNSNNVRYLVNGRNNYRLPAYHRFDIAYSSIKEKQYGKRSWIFSIYNLYSRRNPYFIYEENGQLKQYSLFPIVPTITYRVEF